jgi:hypothetical protein
MAKPTFRHERTIGSNAIAAAVVGLVIIVVAIIWLLFGTLSREKQAPISKTHTTVPTAVTRFARYLQNNPAEEAMAKDHAYTSNGLRRLAEALESLSERDGVHTADITRGLADLRQQADYIQSDPRDTSHAAAIRAAFITATDLLKALQQPQHPDATEQVAQLRQAAAAIDSTKLTLAQKTQVGAFFTRINEVIQTMAQPHN